jgi:hypothetical protein
MKQALIVVLTVLCVLSVVKATDTLLATWRAAHHLYDAMTPNTTEYYRGSDVPFTAHITSIGLRSEPPSSSPEKGESRYLVVGDSFTFGWGVDTAQTWVSILEASSAASGTKMRLINAGVPGADLSFYGDVCARYMQRLHANRLLIGVTTDDLYEAKISSVWQVALTEYIQGALPALTSLTMPVLDVHRWGVIRQGDSIDAQSVWRSIVSKVSEANPSYLSHVSADVRTRLEEGNYPPALAGFAVENASYLTYLLWPETAHEIEHALDGPFSKLRQCAGSRPVTVIFLPSSELISPKYLPYKQSLGYNVSNELSNVDIDSFLQRAAAKKGYSYISPLSDFRADGCPGCYFPYDGHFTAYGNYRAAMVILRELRRLKQ